MEPDFLLYVGSRNGGMIALTFFAALLGGLGYGAAQECRRRGWGVAWARGLGLLLALPPLGLVYVSMVGGFYEVRGHPTHLEVRALLPGLSSQLPWEEIGGAYVRFAYKNSWRLQLVRRSGGRIESTVGSRQDVERAARAITARLSVRRPSR